jgi:hypothetical protein
MAYAIVAKTPDGLDNHALGCEEKDGMGNYIPATGAILTARLNIYSTVCDPDNTSPSSTDLYPFYSYNFSAVCDTTVTSGAVNIEATVSDSGSLQTGQGTIKKTQCVQ